jgi:hypothetical protein
MNDAERVQQLEAALEHQRQRAETVKGRVRALEQEVAVAWRIQVRGALPRAEAGDGIVRTETRATHGEWPYPNRRK